MALRLNGSSSGYVELDVPADAGSHTLTLPDGGGTSGQYLQTNGSGGLSWAGAGKILQVVSTTKKDSASSTSATYTNIPGMSVTIQPSSTNSKILLFGDVQVCMDFGLNRIAIRLTGGNTSSYLSTISHGSAVAAATGISTRVNDSYALWPIPFSYLDSPNTTNSITYQVQWRQPGATNTYYLNYSNSGSDGYSYVATSTITAVEVQD